MSQSAPVQNATTLRAPKRTGTMGDTFISWGLAILAADLTRRQVVLRNTPAAYEVEIQASPEQIAEHATDYQPSAAVMLPWLACAASARVPPSSIGYAVERDQLRDDFDRLRARGQQPGPDGDTPAVAANPLAPKYPLFQVLTNPGTQWAGYNTLVEQSAQFCKPPGVAGLLAAYASDAAGIDLDAWIDGLMKRLGLRSSAARWRNPPGFLFPGSNKGPTMRVDREGVVVGQPNALDWMMADRGDLSTAELYLAYVGYFNVGTVHSYKGGRVVSAPVPLRARVPRALTFLERVHSRSFPKSPPAAAADAALAYADAALAYHADFAPGQALVPTELVINGVELAVFWMPSGNTYAPQSATFAPLPLWLAPLYAVGFGIARETIGEHRRQVRAAGGAESGEARDAMDAYLASLGGDVAAWLGVIPAWYRAVLAERFVGSWSTTEIERIAVALEPELADIIHDPAFEAVTGAIRRVTIQAHYARQNRQRGEGVISSNRPGSPLSPQYDLVGSLQEAAARHPDEFLRELCEFIAAYNDEASRRQHRLVRKEDLEQLIAWLRADRRGLIPALVLAFGVAPRRRTADAPPDEVVIENGADEPVGDE